LKHPASIQPLPLDTADAARSIFNIENVYLSIGDQIDQLFSDLNLSDLDSSGGKQAGSLCTLAMVTIFQYAEKMPDRQAAEALRRRTDWKYALHLSLVTPGFDPDSLCEFRQQLLANASGQEVFQVLLERLAQIGLFSSRTKNSMDARSVILDVCAYSRLDCLAQAMGLSLEALAAYQPYLLREITQAHWFERYQRMPTEFNQIRTKQDLEALAGSIGKDTRYLLEAIECCPETNVANLQEIQDLRSIYHKQFDRDENQVSWLVVCSYCRASKLDSLTL
jgi:transposase